MSNSSKSIKFTTAHAIARATVSVVGNYMIAFSLALKSVNARQVKFTTLKTATDQPGFNREMDTQWILAKSSEGALVIFVRVMKNGAMKTKKAISVTKSLKAAAMPSSAERFITNHAVRYLEKGHF